MDVDVQNWVLKNMRRNMGSHENNFFNINEFQIKDNKIQFLHRSNSIIISDAFPENISLDSMNTKQITWNGDKPLENFRGWPEAIHGDLILSFSTIKSFEFMPKKIKGFIWMFGCKIHSFNYFTQELEKIRHGDHNKLKVIEGYNIIEFISLLPKY